MSKQYLLTFLLLLTLISCTKETRFERLSSSQTGIDFVNELVEDTTFNFLNYLYFYNGGGVAAGDINNDGLEDLFFTSNQQKNKLYLNKGDLKFEDVSESSGIEGQTGSWSTGVTMADVNADGLADIYVCNVNYLSRTGRNELFINNGDNTFTERGKDFGLDFKGYSVQSAFLDYDKDGDLDMFLLNHSVHSVDSYRPVDDREKFDPKSGDRLFRNDNGYFTDVTESAGIYSSALGFGLGVVVSDINNDGWPDIYVGNDFHEDDYLYINQQDGTFRESIRSATQHTSQFTMGVDIADINNDGEPDIAATDMLPEDEEILKISGGGDTYKVARIKQDYGYYPQYSRNMLQLKVADTENGDPVYSEIGYLSGIEATDWSWSGLLADLDNDGYRDLFISNGIYRRPNDMDYIRYISNQEVQRSLEEGINPENLQLIQKMPQLKIPNVIFHNNGDLTFTDLSNEWGLGDPSHSNGTVYSDLDNDGDLDLVVNNVNQEAFVYRNSTSDKENAGNYLQFELHGNPGNPLAFGTKIKVYTPGEIRTIEQYPTRGFQSSVTRIPHIGLGAETEVDSVLIIWPDDSMMKLVEVSINKRLPVYQRQSTSSYTYTSKKIDQGLFSDVTDEVGVVFRHNENNYVDFNMEPLIPHYLSTQGPPVTVADVNGDGLEDFYVGGALGQAGELWLQNVDGTFRKSTQPGFEVDKFSEDTDAEFFDANGDGSPDLIVGSGGNEVGARQFGLMDRLYLNNGKGVMHRADVLPKVYRNTSVVAPGDFDGDGDNDLMTGERSIPGIYGMDGRNFLFRNDGTGKFTDVTKELIPGLDRLGMVTDAAWTDFDNDEDLDLLVVGEWMPVTLFENRLNEDEAAFINMTEAAALGGTNGWWNTMLSTDVNNDGLEDILAGNLGLNSVLTASENNPLLLYMNDFNDDERLDPIITHFKQGRYYPIVSRDELFDQVNSLKKQFNTYNSFGARELDEIFDPEKVEDAFIKKVFTFETSLFLNNGDGTYSKQKLPVETQLSPTFSFIVYDFNEDGRKDILSGGNFFGLKPSMGRYDASFGTTLLARDSTFSALPLNEQGVLITGQIRELQLIRSASGAPLVIVSRNDEPLLFLDLNTIED